MKQWSYNNAYLETLTGAIGKVFLKLWCFKHFNISNHNFYMDATDEILKNTIILPQKGPTKIVVIHRNCSWALFIDILSTCFQSSKSFCRHFLMVSQFKRSISFKINRIEIKWSYRSIDHYRKQHNQWSEQLLEIYTFSYS